MKQIKKEMLKIYKPISNLDWMNYKLVKKDITFHHIVKAENKGKRVIENGALLMPVSHQYLHLIENMELQTFEELNKILKEINTQQREPYQCQREDIEGILQDFEDKHRWEKNKEGVIYENRTRCFIYK